MKIPADQIAILLQDCRTEFLKIPDSFWKDAKGNPIPGKGLIVPLTMYGNKYASFAWLRYHPTVYIGGWLQGSSDKGTIHFFPKELGQAPQDTLEWANACDGGPVAWHSITAAHDEVIAPVIK